MPVTTRLMTSRSRAVEGFETIAVALQFFAFGAKRALLIERLVNRVEQELVVEGFGQHFQGAGLHGPDGQVARRRGQ